MWTIVLGKREYVVMVFSSWCLSEVLVVCIGISMKGRWLVFVLSNEEALRWVDTNFSGEMDKGIWSGSAMGHMITNIVELMNYVFKGTRNLPLLVRATYYKLRALFANRGLKWNVLLRPIVHRKLHEGDEKGNW